MNQDKAKEKLLAGIKEDSNGCWIWQRGKHSLGYGCMMFEGRICWTHRLAYTLFKGEIPERKCVCHHCDNPSCCNPDHLFLGTSRDNTKDRHAKGRDAYGERNGNAKLTDKDVEEIRTKFDGVFGCIKRLAEEYGVSVYQINNILHGKQRMVGITKDWNHEIVSRPPRTEEVKERIRQALKGRPRPKEVVDKIRNSRLKNKLQRTFNL